MNYYGVSLFFNNYQPLCLMQKNLKKIKISLQVDRGQWFKFDV